MNAVALACVAALGFLLFGLGLAISGRRFRERALHGHANDPADLLHKLVRAHGNTAEYAAFAAVLMLYLGSHGPTPWVVWMMVAFTLSRFMLAAGLILAPSMNRPNPLRFIGASGTYFCGVALCVALLRGS